MWKKIPYVVILSGGILWGLLILSVPFLAEGNQNSRKISVMIRLFFSPICHQNPDRSFHCNDHPLPLCARCSGIYTGFLLGSLGYPLLRKFKKLHSGSFWVLLFGALPTVLEFSITITRLSNSNSWIRGITGLFLGGSIAFIILSILVEYEQ